LTLIVGILCSDGVVIASDSAATYAQDAVPTIGQQQVTKIKRLGDELLFSSTGSIGTSQLISSRLHEAWTAKQLNIKSAGHAMESISKLIYECTRHLLEAGPPVAQLAGQQVAASPILCKSIVALPVQHRPSLFTFEYSSAPEQITDELPFVALGSGQNIADPFLAFLKRILWTSRQPTVGEGRFVAAWTINHAEKVVPGFVGGPIQMACLTGNKNPKIEFVDPAEHENRIALAETQIRDFILNPGVQPVSAPVPDVPKPTS
jgi:20S proteasome alpha/beta subunit